MNHRIQYRSALLFASFVVLGALGGPGCGGVQGEPAGADGGLVDAEPGRPDAEESNGDPDGGPSIGHVLYHRDGHVYRIADQPGAVPQDVSAALDRFQVSAGTDDAANISADGAWIVMSSQRFQDGCGGWACLVRVSGDLSSVEPILAGGAAVHVEGFFAIGSGGDLVVYTGNDGPNGRDLYAVRRVGGLWRAPVLLTGNSTRNFHNFPAISPDGSRVVHSCGPEARDNRGICEVATDGSGFREVMMPSHVPAGQTGPAVSLHHPHYGPGGAIVFEGDWDGERIWRLDPGHEDPVLISSEFSNDNSPCVLPNGRIASLWLNRPGNPNGVHELKIMSINGREHDMLVADVDVDDWGLGCGR